MRKGSLPRQVAASLPACLIDRHYAPDGLDEAAIDALIEEAYSEVIATPTRPAWSSLDEGQTRRVRRRVRRAVRLLPDVLAADQPTSPTPSHGEAA